MDTGTKQNPLPYALSPEFRGRESREPEHDPGKLPLLPKYERFPHLRPPRRQPWRQTLRKRLENT